MTAFRAPDLESLEWWRERFDEHGVAHKSIEQRGGKTALRFTNPEGQKLEIVDDSQR